MIRSSHLIYHVQIWASLSHDDFTLISTFQKSSIFTLEKIWTFLLSFSSWCLRRTPSTRHLFHLEHLSLEWTPSALIPFDVTKLIYSDTNCCVHNSDTILTMIPIVRKYRDPHRRPQARHGIDYLEHTRWILKDIRRRNTQFNLVRSKLGLRPLGENLIELY